MEIIQEGSNKTIINNDINYDLLKMISEIQVQLINMEISKTNSGIESNHSGSYDAQAKNHLIKLPKSVAIKIINNDMKKADSNPRTRVETLADILITYASDNAKSVGARTEAREK